MAHVSPPAPAPYGKAMHQLQYPLYDRVGPMKRMRSGGSWIGRAIGSVEVALAQALFRPFLAPYTGIFRLVNSRPAMAEASPDSITIAPSWICLRT